MHDAVDLEGPVIDLVVYVALQGVALVVNVDRLVVAPVFDHVVGEVVTWATAQEHFDPAFRWRHIARDSDQSILIVYTVVLLSILERESFGVD